VAAGTYTSAQTVTISDTTPNATIYYAINGTPTTSSSVYNSSSPITVSSTETLEAIATASGYSTSALKTADYTINLPNPAPVVDSISPAFINAGSAAFTLTVNGSGFIASSTVYWGTSALATTYGSATQLTAQVTAADIATAGTTAAITVQTPTPGGGTSNALQFEVDSAPGTTTGPVFTSSTATVAAGSTANYPVTLASGVMSVTVTCLNLPPGATCNYVPGPPGTVTIATSSSTPAGTYQITVVFTLTESGSGTGFILLPILLLPLVFLRRKLAARSVWITACLGLVLLAGVAFVGCGGDATHQATSSGVVTLTVQ
jgi:hypothetical protein